MNMLKDPTNLAVITIFWVIIIVRILFIVRKPQRLETAMLISATTAITFGTVAVGTLLSSTETERVIPVLLCAFIAISSIAAFVKFRERYLSIPGNGQEEPVILKEGSYKIVRKPVYISRPRIHQVDTWHLVCEKGVYRIINAPRFDANSAPEINVVLWKDGTCRINYPFNIWDIIELLILAAWAVSPFFAAKAYANGGFPPENPAFPYSGAMAHILGWALLEVVMFFSKEQYTQNSAKHTAIKIGLWIFGFLFFFGQIAAIISNVKYVF